ncbi:MAG TPA: hypothetical protein VLM38_12455 [Blastocatellia bacterium]|nr:hypothetical protein [Blastocatellia bacterium]
MSHHRIFDGCRIIVGAAVIALSGLICSSCTTAGTSTNTNESVSPSAPVQPAPTAVIEAREPDAYSVVTTINVQPTGNAPQTSIPPLQFRFARLGTDRRLSFNLPEPVGEVIYIEKSPLKYLIFPSRNQYVELDPNELGFQLGELMSPASVIARLKERGRYETMGTETINGRVAIKYRFAGSADTHTKAGTAQADSIVYVDQQTGVPLRSEIETTTSSGAGARIVTSADELKFTADNSMFEIPNGMKKVTSTELKQQVQSFMGAMRAVAGYLRQQVSAPTTGGQ